MGVRAVRVCGLVLLVLVGLLVIGGASTALAGASTGTTDAAGIDGVSNSDNESSEPPLSDYDKLVTEYAVDGNGSATVTVEYRYRLDEGNRSVEWEELRSAIESDPDAYIDRFRDRRAEMATNESNGMNDEMELTDFDVEVSESTGPPEYGQVTFDFHWSSFAHVEMNRIVIGEALEEFVMDERTDLVISWPEPYENTSIEPEPDDSRATAAIWYGDQTQEFVGEEPRVEVIASGGDEDESTDGGVPIPWVAGLGAVVLLALAAGGWWFTRRRESADAPSATPVTDSPEPNEPASGTEEPPVELLSNEERVLRLLEARGGRIKQQEVVSELDWTEAKTSQVVSGLREADDIDVFRIGRENVLALPEDGDSTGDGTNAPVDGDPTEEH